LSAGAQDSLWEAEGRAFLGLGETSFRIFWQSVGFVRLIMGFLWEGPKPGKGKDSGGLEGTHMGKWRGKVVRGNG